jgi:aarF domain-containing kinase
MKLCVWAGVLDVDAARMSFDEFARQLLNELDYLAEASNLKTIYESSIEQPDSIYQQHNIVVPRVLQDYCTPKVITMTYLPGSKLEEEARRQLELLGIDTRRKIGDVIREAADEVSEVNQREQGVAHVVDEASTMPTTLTITSSSSWMERSAKWVGKVVGLNNILYSIRFMQRLVLEITAAAVSTIQMAAPVLPNSLCEWATAHQMARQQAERLSLTESWIHGLFDVHGHQVFELGLFNADPHPGVSRCCSRPE